MFILKKTRKKNARGARYLISQRKCALLIFGEKKNNYLGAFDTKLWRVGLVIIFLLPRQQFGENFFIIRPDKLFTF